MIRCEKPKTVAIFTEMKNIVKETNLLKQNSGEEATFNVLSIFCLKYLLATQGDLSIRSWVQGLELREDIQQLEVFNIKSIYKEREKRKRAKDRTQGYGKISD